MNKLTQPERDAIMAREATLKAYCVAQGFTGRNGWTSYKPEQIANLNPPTNEERSAVEVFDFCHAPPDRYFLYINEEKKLATTWTGDTLGTVYLGREFRDNFGGKRVPVSIQAINGKRYAGTYFKSAGNYARVKVCK